MAFIWLVRSYALQKTELAETRKALEESRAAQQEQARLALLAARTEALSIRLSAVNGELSALRMSHNRVITYAEARGIETAIIADDGKNIRADRAIASLYALIKQAEHVQGAIIDELNAINEDLA